MNNCKSVDADPIGRYVAGMRRNLVIASTLCCGLGACAPHKDHFLVADEDKEAVSAEVHLCDHITPLVAEEDGFTGQAEVRCEGSGEVEVQMRDGSTMACIVGYVTPGAPQEWRYEIEGGECKRIAPPGP